MEKETGEDGTGGLRISAVVPVYNVEGCLQKCVDSLLGQEDMEGQLEILLVDDGSTDKSGALCDCLAKKNGQIRVIHKENGGLSSARNAGIDKARGDYVLFVDSDDYIEKNTCRVLKSVLRAYEGADAAVYDGVEDSGSKETPIRRSAPREARCVESGKCYLLENYRKRNLNVQAWLYAWRREFLLAHGLRFQEGILHEDVEFTPRALLLCGRVAEVPDRLYHYVVRENSISTQKNKEKNIRDLFATLKKLDHLAGQQEPELRKWMKEALLDSYLNMVQEARMYRKPYRELLDRRFLLGRAATSWSRLRAGICFVNVRLYCFLNDCYKRLRAGWA